MQELPRETRAVPSRPPSVVRRRLTNRSSERFNGVPLPQVESGHRRIVERHRERGENGDDEPDHTGPPDRRRETRIASDSQGARLSPRFPGQPSSTALTRLRCRPWFLPPPDPEPDRSRIAANVDWLERAQIKPGRSRSPGPELGRTRMTRTPCGRQLQYAIRPARA